LLARILPMAGAPWLIALLAPAALLAQANPLPPPPVPAASLAPSPVSSPANLDLGGAHRGGRLAINALEQRARWLWLGDGSSPAELWLPLEVLQNQLGVSSVSRGGSQLELQWYGRSLPLPPQRQRNLDDEVAVEVAGLLSDVGVAVQRDGERLSLTLPPSPLLGLRLGNAGRRLVLDLAAPAALRSDPNGLLVGVRARPDQLAALQGLGLATAMEASGPGLRLSGAVREDMVEQWFQSVLTRDHRFGAALGLVGKIDILKVGLRAGRGEGMLQFAGELSL
jgi:hypothetical protein